MRIVPPQNKSFSIMDGFVKFPAKAWIGTYAPHTYLSTTWVLVIVGAHELLLSKYFLQDGRFYWNNGAQSTNLVMAIEDISWPELISLWNKLCGREP